MIDDVAFALKLVGRLAELYADGRTRSSLDRRKLLTDREELRLRRAAAVRKAKGR